MWLLQVMNIVIKSKFELTADDCVNVITRNQLPSLTIIFITSPQK